MSKKSVMVIAGEISGDLHAAALVRAVQQRNNEILFFGIGGEELEKAGMEICHNTRDMAVLGFSEVLRKYFFFRNTFYDMVTLLRERKPDAVLLVDYPGFNLPFAAHAHELGIKVVYYICPQVWAWNRGRIPALAKNVDRLISIFPFEADAFKATKLKVDFVGHPLVSAAEAARSEPLLSLPWSGSLLRPEALPASPKRSAQASAVASRVRDYGGRVSKVAILPGSRKQEIKLILPVMAMAADILKKKNPDAGFMIAAASREALSWIEQILSAMGMTGKFSVVADKTRQILRQADAAWVASGTATIETALMRCPMVVVYRVRLLTYLAGRLLIRVPFLGMVNIVAGKQICPEFIQHAARPENLAAAIEPLIVEGKARNEMINELDRVRSILGTPGAEERAAKILLKELE